MFNRPLRPRPPWLKRVERIVERLIWRLRLIAILPVVMSLVTSVVTFSLATMEIVHVLTVLGRGACPSKFWFPSCSVARFRGSICS